jgi:hypothetical protein
VTWLSPGFENSYKLQAASYNAKKAQQITISSAPALDCDIRDGKHRFPHHPETTQSQLFPCGKRCSHREINPEARQ